MTRSAIMGHQAPDGCWDTIKLLIYVFSGQIKPKSAFVVQKTVLLEPQYYTANKDERLNKIGLCYV